ncbi:MAG: GYD domain-containing protein [Chloroflexota bacterium]|nr:GYD domain-containing protein [Chloroflexota bacterium]MDE2970368.1 GYD domain-containing protein [Chloroflexota bacterium]
MPKYLFTADYTASGIAGLQKEGGTGRRDMFSAMFEGLGGKMEAFYYGFGADDLYIIVDLPDDASAAAASMEVAKAGAITFRATVLITPETMDEAAGKAVTYRPPGA